MAMSAGVAKLRPGDPLLDVNRATEAELLRLPGIGPTLANRIVSQRPYHAVDDLRRVKGIGVKTLESLRPFVQVQSP
jgi:competence protein ComEA